MSGKVTGATADIYVEGQTGEVSVCFDCTIWEENQHQCPFMLAPIMPPEPGMKCTYKDFGCCLAAKMDALKRAKAAIVREMKRIEEEME